MSRSSRQLLDRLDILGGLDLLYGQPPSLFGNVDHVVAGSRNRLSQSLRRGSAIVLDRRGSTRHVRLNDALDALQRCVDSPDSVDGREIEVQDRAHGDENASPQRV